MNHRQQPRSWLIFVWLICALVYLSLQYSPESLTPAKKASTTTFPNTYIEGVINNTYDKDGNLHYRLSAKEIIHQKSVAINTRILTPQITFYRNTKSSPWNLTAKQGVSYDDLSIIELQDNIHIWNEHTELGRIEMTTDKLHINTQEESVHTDKPVTMRTQTSLTTATGMIIQFKQEKIELLSSVKGSYAPR